MVFYCEKCRFLFERVAEPDNCPDCGSSWIRHANINEEREFRERQEHPEELEAETI
jgi:rRNA maturation endonuclease Nob1